MRKNLLSLLFICICIFIEMQNSSATVYINYPKIFTKAKLSSNSSGLDSSSSSKTTLSSNKKEPDNLHQTKPKSTPINSNELLDSIRNLISEQTDFNNLQNTFDLIRKSRKKLKNNYLPLLKEFAIHSNKATYYKGEMKAYDFIGLQYRYNENYDSAYYYHIKSLDMAKELKDSTQMFYNYNNLGQVFRMQDNNTLAIDYFLKALETSNAVGNLRSSSFTMNTIGATLVVQNDYARAMSYYKRSNAIAQDRDDKRTMAYNYGNMGEVYLLTEQPDSAMYYFKMSRDMLVKLGSDKGMGVAEHLIGQAYIALGEYEKAKEKFLLALSYHKNDNSLRYQSLCNCHLGKIAVAQNYFSDGLMFLDRAKEQALEINSLKNLLEIYNVYVELYKKQNQWEKVYDALTQSHQYREQIINESNNSSIHALEIRFDTNEKEQRITLLSAENQIKNQRIILFLTLSIILLLILSLGILLYYRNKRINQQKQETLRQQLLRSQMNPHFLFNALGSIQSYMFKNKTTEAAGYLNNFASLTRSILNHSAAETVLLDDEINALHNYIKLEQMRVQNTFSYAINYNDCLETELIKIPPMLIQPFVENAIKHGLKNKENNGELNITIEDREDTLMINISDNGEGFYVTEKQNKGHKSMAMSIFKQRINLLKKKYSKKAGFHIESDQGKGTKVTIHIPIIE